MHRATPDGEEATAAWIQSALKPHVDSGFYTVTPLKFAMAVKVRNRYILVRRLPWPQPIPSQLFLRRIEKNVAHWYS
jgi:hypothetical protein